MKVKTRISILAFCTFLTAGTLAADDRGRQDARALEVLKSMSAYTASLDSVMIKGVNLTDAQLGGGLMIANSTEVKVRVDRPGSVHISSFDGHQTKEIYFHAGTLSVYDSETKFYAQSSIPKDIEAAMEFALEELEVEAPLMDMIYQDASTHLISDKETVLYLTDKARIAGKDCHHIAIRGTDADVQLWVEEGARPVPRKIMITSKWEGGAPRFVSNMAWESDPEFDPDLFEFKAPEGSINIGFADNNRQGEE